jgi:capsid portal protein
MQRMISFYNGELDRLNQAHGDVNKKLKELIIAQVFMLKQLKYHLNRYWKNIQIVNYIFNIKTISL